MPLGDIISVLALVVATISASYAYQAVRRSNGPSVWAVVSAGHEEPGSVDIRIHNGGPGLALDVRAARIQLNQPPPPSLRRPLLGHRWKRSSAWDPTPRVRALGPGEENPPNPDWHFVGFRPPEELNEPFWVAVRYNDTAEKPWEVGVPWSQTEAAYPPRRLRRGRWWCKWQFWREPADEW